MKVACIAFGAVALLSINVEARIGKRRRLEDELALEIVGNDGDWDEYPLGENGDGLLCLLSLLCFHLVHLCIHFRPLSGRVRLRY